MPRSDALLQKAVAQARVMNHDELVTLLDWPSAEELFAAGENANFISWKTGTVPTSGAAGAHMASFDYAYNCKAVMEWLFDQSK